MCCSIARKEIETVGWLTEKLSSVFSKKTKYADTLNGFTPVFTQFGSNIYASDVVQQAVSCIVQEMSKLRPLHVRNIGDDLAPVNGSSLQAVLREPNPFMAKTDFLEKITWQLMLNYNAFAVPIYRVSKDKDGNEKRKYIAIYPIQPTQVDFIEDAASQLFVKFTFANNFNTTLPYSDVIHIRKNFSVSDYMGGGENGQPDHSSLLETLQLNKDLLKGVSAAMKSSFAINGVVKIGSIIGKEETMKALDEFEKALQSSKSGILPLDAKSEYVKIGRDVKLVDADTLKFVDEKILRFWGVPIPILTGDYTKAQYEAFYQKTIEPLVNKFTDAFTKALFTEREKSFGNEVMFYPKDLVFMSVDQTIEMVRLLGDAGELYSNEKRTAFGLRPLPELVGVRMQSLNYVNVEIANKYQLEEQVKNNE